VDRESFDDVVSHIVEEPEPPRPPRRPRRVRRWALAAGASVIVAGALAAGASALTGSSEKEQAKSAASERALPVPGDSTRYMGRGHICHHGQFHNGAAGDTPPATSE
jgi:hypothetical protein